MRQYRLTGQGTLLAVPGGLQLTTVDRTSGASDQAGPDGSDRVISPAPEWDAETRWKVTSDMTGSDPDRRLSVGMYWRNQPLNVRGRACVTAIIHSLLL
jgi:hypothetical protein